MIAGLFIASKVGCTTAASFNSSTSTATQLLLMRNVPGPVMMLLRPTVDCYIRQGDSSVTATTSDIFVPANTQYPLVVEGDNQSYLAAIGDSSSGTLFCTVVSTTNADLCPTITEWGIWGGGQTSSAIGTVVSTMSRYVFLTDVVMSSTASLASTTTGITALAATGPATAAYFCGGQVDTLGAGTGAVNTIQKYTYASDSIATLAATLSQIRNDCTGNANSTAGYIAKGTINGNTTATTQRKITWSSDTESLAGSWSSNNGSSGGGPYTFGKSTMGFWCGGSTASTEQRKQKILYSTDTFSQVDPVLVGARAAGICQQGFGDTTVGLMVGGQNSAATPIATSEKFTYSTETSATTTSLAAARSNGASTGNTTKGVIMSGKVGAPYAVSSSITWTLATDTEGVGGTALAAVEHAAATGPTHGGLQ